MTQRDLPTKIGPATVVEPPTVSSSTGSWTTGLSDFIDADHFEALKRMSGLTIDPDILSINGRAHIIERLDEDEE